MSTREIIGSYQVGPEVGTWGTQTLYRGTRVADGSKILLATLRTELRSNPSSRGEHQRSMKLQCHLEGECLPRPRDVVRDADDIPWLVLDRPPGLTLSQQIPGGGLSPEQACVIALCVLDALEDAHNVGIVHGYISPENVLVDLVGHGKRPLATLLGIGGVRAGTSQPPASGSGAELAPEVRQGQPVSKATDVFLVGALLYEMLSGVPLSRDLDAEELKGVLLSRNGSVPSLLVSSLLRSVATRAGERTDNLAEFADHLTPYAYTSGGDQSSRLPSRYVELSQSATDRGSLPAWLIAQAPKPHADSACPQAMLVTPAFPKAPQTPRMDSLFAEVFRRDTERTAALKEPATSPAENKTAAVAVSAGAGLGAALAWLSALL